MSRIRWGVLIGVLSASVAHAAGGASWLPRTLGNNSITPSMFTTGVLISSACPYDEGSPIINGDQSTNSVVFISPPLATCSVTFTLATARTVTAVFSGALWLALATDSAVLGCSIDGDAPGNSYVAFTSGNLNPGSVVSQRTQQLAAGAHTIALVYRTGNGANAVTVRNQSLSVWVMRP